MLALALKKINAKSNNNELSTKNKLHSIDDSENIVSYKCTPTKSHLPRWVISWHISASGSTWLQNSGQCGRTASKTSPILPVQKRPQKSLLCYVYRYQWCCARCVRSVLDVLWHVTCCDMTLRRLQCCSATSGSPFGCFGFNLTPHFTCHLLCITLFGGMKPP